MIQPTSTEPETVVAKRKNRVTWGLVMVLGGVMLGGAGLLLIHFRPYLVARFFGREANLTQASLPNAWLARANLRGAQLTGSEMQRADLRSADLRDSSLVGADLRGANLEGADLSNAYLRSEAYVWIGSRRTKRRTDLRGANLKGANLGTAHIASERMPTISGHRVIFPPPILTGAVYDTHTRWPSGFDPVKAGAVMEKSDFSHDTTPETSAPPSKVDLTSRLLGRTGSYCPKHHRRV